MHSSLASQPNQRRNTLNNSESILTQIVNHTRGEALREEASDISLRLAAACGKVFDCQY